MRNSKKKLTNNEFQELEKLALKFGRKFNIIDIEGEFVYGYTKERKEYLGTKEEYCKYRKLKSKVYSMEKRAEKMKSEEYKAHKSFLESSRLGI